ncbi:extracellular solute-binding protein [Pontibacillus yanchengensis]|uniref:Extracellular solute-binding protein n=2 Tax=Pontibacillus yanchengensis TaxID=462910 RepID=A0ACC7VE34_9BACI|nr:extracellular solute-binding protein [Pontibacillus yanchengensis]MYL32280.1 extracellular solute-binding protein [Pontibacillus yanchengensis]MYL52860.1 extracellular solute-binding protein [Pontibacillus yanchengensis]
MKKWLGLFLALGLIVGLMAACGPNEESSGNGGDSGESSGEGDSQSTEGEGSSEEQPKPDKLIVWEDQDKGEALEAAAKKFTDETGIEIEYVEYNITKMQENMALDGSTEKAPDVVTMSHDGVGPSVAKGYIKPIEVSDDVLNKYTQSSVDALTYQDKLYGLPKAVETTVFIYNKDKMEEPPESMDEMYEMSKTAKEEGNYGFLATWDNFYFSHGIFHGFGANVFGESPSEIGLNSEAGVEAINYIDKWYEEGLFPEGLLSKNAASVVDRLFTDGDAIAVQNGPWAFQNYTDKGVNYGVAPMPDLPNGEPQGTFMGVKGWFVTSFSQQKGKDYWAEEFVKVVSNEENAKERYDMTGEIPPLKALVEDEEWVSNNPGAAAVMEQSKNAVAMPVIPEMAEVWDPMKTAVQSVATDKTDAQKALDDAVNVIKQQIEANY